MKRIEHDELGAGTVIRETCGGMFYEIKFDRTPEPFAKYYNENPIMLLSSEVTNVQE